MTKSNALERLHGCLVAAIPYGMVRSVECCAQEDSLSPFHYFCVCDVIFSAFYIPLRGTTLNVFFISNGKLPRHECNVMERLRDQDHQMACLLSASISPVPNLLVAVNRSD